MKVVTVLGARPQFIKSWALSHALRLADTQEIVVHTGQHYDEALSGRFFTELGLAEPHHHLGVGSGPHGAQTGKMIEGIERVLAEEKPDWVLVYGDTNSTLAAALAAVKLHQPVAHIEAGLRSFNRRMPEEINRVLTDHASTLLLCPSRAAIVNLAREGITRGVHEVGDVMQDSLRHFAARARTSSRVLEQLGLPSEAYHVATLHRAELTDNLPALRRLLSLLNELDRPVILPLHPRTRHLLERNGGVPANGGQLQIIAPLGYLDMVRLVGSCRRVLTDSGGLQKEAYWMHRPCITLRPQTEWVETVEAGWNIVTDCDPERIRAALASDPPAAHPDLYGDGHAAEKIVSALRAHR